VPALQPNTLAQTGQQSGPTTLTTLLKAPRKWDPDSFEKRKRDDALVSMVIGCGLPMTTVEKPTFRDFCTSLDPRYKVPSRGKLNQLFDHKYMHLKKQVIEALKYARRITVGMDIWTKKGYTSSYLCITASFFHLKSHRAVHELLNLFTINHPHTGDKIS